MINKNSLLVLLLPIPFMYGCTSYSWEDAQKVDTHEAYQEYIEVNPEGEHVEEARERAEVRYWETVKYDSTEASFQAYLNRYPNGQFQNRAEEKLDQLARANLASEGRVTGSNVIIRRDHTTDSSSAGVVARKGTIVQILDFYSTENSKEAILSSDVKINQNGRQIDLASGKAVRILSDHIDSVEVSVSTAQHGIIEAKINKENVEPMSGERWYKITTRDNITGWIYGKFIKEL